MSASPARCSAEQREKYVRSRYLEHLPPEGLGQRYTDLLCNILAFAADGRRYFLEIEPENDWARRIADVVAEVDLRGLPSAWLWEVEQVVLGRPFPRVARALEAWGSRDQEPDSFLVKYGRREHMAALVERGLIRLTPASSYNDSSLNPAMRDSELEFPTHFPPRTRIRMELDRGSGVYHDIPRIVGLITQTQRCEDYYVFCASGAFDPRAFDDFSADYDACVLIRDWKRFAEAFRSQPVPARELAVGPILYVDPFEPPFEPHRRMKVAFLKHLRYAYQYEWRIVWTRPTMAPPLPFFLELGDLSSYCELIVL